MSNQKTKEQMGNQKPQKKSTFKSGKSSLNNSECEAILQENLEKIDKIMASNLEKMEMGNGGISEEDHFLKQKCFDPIPQDENKSVYVQTSSDENEIYEDKSKVPIKNIAETMLSECNSRFSLFLDKILKRVACVSNKAVPVGQQSFAKQMKSMWTIFVNNIKGNPVSEEEVNRKKQIVEILTDTYVKLLTKCRTCFGKGFQKDCCKNGAIPLQVFKQKRGVKALRKIQKDYGLLLDSLLHQHLYKHQIPNSRQAPKQAIVYTVQNPTTPKEFMDGKTWDKIADLMVEATTKTRLNDDKVPLTGWKKGAKTKEKIHQNWYFTDYFKEILQKIEPDGERTQAVSFCLEHFTNAPALHKKIKSELSDKYQKLMVQSDMICEQIGLYEDNNITEEHIYQMIQHLLKKHHLLIYPKDCPVEIRKGLRVRIPQALIPKMDIGKDYFKMADGNFFYEAHSAHAKILTESHARAHIVREVINNVNSNLQALIDNSSTVDQGNTRHMHVYQQACKKGSWQTFDAYLRTVFEPKNYGWMQLAKGSPADNLNYHSKETAPKHWINGKFKQLKGDWQKWGLDQLKTNSCTHVEEMWADNEDMPSALYQFLKSQKNFYDPLHYTAIQKDHICKKYTKQAIKLRQWQFQLLMCIFKLRQDDIQRRVWWLYEKMGKAGKNWVIDLITTYFGGIVVNLSDATDLKHFSWVLDNHKFILLNLVQSDYLNNTKIFNLIENVQQNSVPATRKYGQKPQPKIETTIIVFANGAPWTICPYKLKSTLSGDRWIILKIEDQEQKQKDLLHKVDSTNILLDKSQKRKREQIGFKIGQELVETIQEIQKNTDSKYQLDNMEKLKKKVKTGSQTSNQMKAAKLLNTQCYLDDRKANTLRNFSKFHLTLKHVTGKVALNAWSIDQGIELPCNPQKVQQYAMLQDFFDTSPVVTYDSQDDFGPLLKQLFYARELIDKLKAGENTWTFKNQMKLLQQGYKHYCKTNNLNRFEGTATEKFLENFNKLNHYTHD